jgi:hypothetical protein
VLVDATVTAAGALVFGFGLGLLVALVLRRHRSLDVRLEFHAERADEPRRRDDADDAAES